MSYSEETVISDIYDALMGNTMHKTLNFPIEFDRSYFDSDGAKIYLLSTDKNMREFKITIERV